LLTLGRARGWSQFYFVKLLLVHAQGIEAEILFCGFAAKKIAADSPVFSVCLPADAKNAPVFFRNS
jgi:hypothetical protein